MEFHARVSWALHLIFSNAEFPSPIVQWHWACLLFFFYCSWTMIISTWICFSIICIESFLFYYLIRLIHTYILSFLFSFFILKYILYFLCCNILIIFIFSIFLWCCVVWILIQHNTGQCSQLLPVFSCGPAALAS